jgi:hypothetical protein
LRGAALIAVLAGACGSLGLTLHAGRGNRSLFLVVLFVVWVLAPFVGLLVAAAASKRRSVALYSLMLVLPLASVAIYADVALGRPRAKPAFAFLVVPAASWLLLAVALVSGRLSRRGGGA